MSIGIIGFGFVGQAVYSGFNTNKKTLLIYDKNKKHDTMQDILETEACFVCVPTPTINGQQDATAVQDVLTELYNAGYQGIVIIKSTVLPSKICCFERELKIVYNPEFLNQITAKKDFISQTFLILGGDLILTEKVKLLYAECSKCAIEKVFQGSIHEAINFKYIHNIYHAYKALFWNYVNETVGNYRLYANIYESVIGRNEMSTVAADGSPGVGGACFPKDMVAFNSMHKHPLGDFLEEYNSSLRPGEMAKVCEEGKQ